MVDGPLITAVTGLLIAVGSGVAWLVQRRDKARPRIARQAAEVAQASDAVGGALTIVQSSLTAEIERLQRDRDADRARLTADRDTDRERIGVLEKTTENLRRDVTALRETEARLVRWLRAIRLGVASGSIPPWPQDPDWLAEVERRYPE